jgi:5-methylcytosine-specific restriction endonuclease McrA
MFSNRQEFYNTTAWRKARRYIKIKYHGVCHRCGKAGTHVHHIKPVTDYNCNDVDITLKEDNLMLLCHDCHNYIHYGSKYIRDDVVFDDDGNMIKRE